MADASIHKPYVLNGWTISPRGNVWQVVNKYGEVGAGADTKTAAENFARNNNAKQRLS